MGLCHSTTSWVRTLLVHFHSLLSYCEVRMQNTYDTVNMSKWLLSGSLTSDLCAIIIITFQITNSRN